MLLVTRGLDPKTETQAMTMFGRYFVESNLVNESYKPVIDCGVNNAKSDLVQHEEAIITLSQDVKLLYSTMDDSLRFKTEEKASSESSAADTKIKKVDYRGVGCPMNFVKTKLVLDTMGSGHQLEVLLDDGAPIQNVPGSVEGEGHAILSKTQDPAGHWAVVIQKKG